MTTRLLQIITSLRKTSKTDVPWGEQVLWSLYKTFFEPFNKYWTFTRWKALWVIVAAFINIILNIINFINTINNKLLKKCNEYYGKGPIRYYGNIWHHDWGAQLWHFPEEVSPKLNTQIKNQTHKWTWRPEKRIRNVEHILFCCCQHFILRERMNTNTNID